MGLPVIVLRAMLALIIGVLLYVVSFTAVAQNAPPSYQADPDVYKVIFEDQNFRVILSTRKKGVRDKDHSHPIPSVAYLLPDKWLAFHFTTIAVATGSGRTTLT